MKATIFRNARLLNGELVYSKKETYINDYISISITNLNNKGELDNIPILYIGIGIDAKKVIINLHDQITFSAE